jgi:hypothetical protein
MTPRQKQRQAREVRRTLDSTIDKLQRPVAVLSLVETYPQHMSKREHAAVVALQAAYKVLLKAANRRADALAARNEAA